MPTFALDGSRIRITIFSPNSVGSVLTRKSIALLPNLSFMRPSCGTRFSAMSSREMTLMRDGELVLDRDRRLRDLAQLAVDAEAHAVVVLVGLEVQVGRAQVDRVDQHLLQEADDRRVFDIVETSLLLGLRRVTSSVTSNSKSPDDSASIVSAALAPHALEQLGELVVLDDHPFGRQLGRELDALDGFLVGRVGAADEQAVAALAENHDLVLRGELAVDDVLAAGAGRRPRRGRATAARAQLDSVWARSAGETAPAAMTDATKLTRFSRELSTSSSAALAFSLPAWTSTLATPERADWGASARVSKRCECSIDVCEKRIDHRRFTQACKRGLPGATPTIHARRRCGGDAEPAWRRGSQGGWSG